MDEDRRAYFFRRAGEARGLAEQASDDHVRTIHLEMAVRYELSAKTGGHSGGEDGGRDDDD